MQLGSSVDGRALTYDVALYEFRLARELVSLEDVRELDAHAHIRWLALEQRDWFRRINPADFVRCNRTALARAGSGRYADMTPEERVQADAARDDSVIAGKIVDADPALVQAVAAQLEAQGLLGGGMQGQPTAYNPLAAANLPKGMEALSQMERHHGADRKMTPAEKRLMKKILKNDDKEKARREKIAARTGSQSTAEDAQEGKTSTPQARITSNAINVVAADPQHHRFPEIHYTDSAGNPISPAADAVRPDMEQLAEAVSEEERALTEMRKRNREAEQASLMVTDVPGMEQVKGRVKPKGKTGKRQGDARINGVEVNADGSRKSTAFKKFLGGLGQVVDTVAPLAGGGRGGGGMGGMGGSSGGYGGGMGGPGR